MNNPNNQHWPLPELPPEILASIREEVINDLRIKAADHGRIPTKEEIIDWYFFDGPPQEVVDREKKMKAEWRVKHSVWKPRFDRPNDYSPPKSAEDVRERFSRGETYFTGSRFLRADFSRFPGPAPVNFEGSHFEECDFSNACFVGSSFRGCTFKDCLSFRSSKLDNADFSGANFIGDTQFGANTTLKHAVLDGANLRTVRALRFDGNSILGTTLPSDLSADTWSKLKRKYNGLTLIFSSLLLIVFLVFFSARIVTLIVYDQFRTTEQVAVKWLRETLPEPAFSEFESRLEDHGFRLTDCSDPAAECPRKYAIVAPFTDTAAGPFLPAALILSTLMFFFRYYLTTSISTLREQESLSSVTPEGVSYHLLAAAHKVVAGIRWPLGIYYFFVLWQIAFTEIYV